MRFPGPEAKEAGFEASTTRGSRGKRRFFSTRRTSRSSIPPLDDEVVPCIGEGLASSSCKPPAMPLASSAKDTSTMMRLLEEGHQRRLKSIFAYLWAEGSPQGYAAALGATGWEAPARVPVRWKRSDVERLE